jgi:23S rRNA (cytosine1962-C5)-methyltransferase
MIKVFLKAGKDEPVRRFHPWVFSGAIARTEGRAADGDLAEVYDRSGNLLGVGHFHHGSIAVRLLGFGETDPASEGFWVDKFGRALAVRVTAGLAGSEDTDCYRLAHGEGDGLSGLIVDVYADTAVVQCHSIGMHRQKELITSALRVVLGPKLRAVYDKSAETLPPKYAESVKNGCLWSASENPPGNQVVTENGVLFRVDWETGQKTGFFLDQRENRKLLRQYVNGKTVLNAFCYTGGFSAYALKAGAKTVHSVDVSAKAMELTEENMRLNAPFAGTHEGFADDVLKFLKNAETRYEVLIIDPPAYAKSIEKRHNAVQGYKRLNEAAIRCAAPGAVLFTFSCSQVVDRELFYHTIVAAALEAGRPARVLHHLTQGPDHPVSLFHAEGAYLKGLVVYLE